MAVSLHDTGEEFLLDYVFTDSPGSKPATLDVGLFDDSTAALTDSSDVGDIAAGTEEPNDGNYARQSVSFDATGFSTTDSSGDWQADTDSTITFDLTNTTGPTVDSYFVVVNFQSDDKSDTGATDHLFWTGSLSSSRDTGSLDQLDLDPGAVGLSIS